MKMKIVLAVLVAGVGFVGGRWTAPDVWLDPKFGPPKMEFIDGVCFGVGINSFLKAKGQPFSLNAEGEEELWQFHVRHPGRPNAAPAIVPFEPGR